MGPAAATATAAQTATRRARLVNAEEVGSRWTLSYAAHGNWGWECQFLYSGELACGRRWTLRADALAEFEERRQELESLGWTVLTDV